MKIDNNGRRTLQSESWKEWWHALRVLVVKDSCVLRDKQCRFLSKFVQATT